MDKLDSLSCVYGLVSMVINVHALLIHVEFDVGEDVGVILRAI